MTQERDIHSPDGRRLHVYGDDAVAGDDRLVVFWHHGTPNVGPPPQPLAAESARLGIRWVSHDRPGYGRSSRQLGRSIASVAGDVTAIADALGIERFAVMGHSGGGPHALACAALLPDRVRGVVAGASLAPFTARGLNWFAGMAPAGEAELAASVAGRAVLEPLLLAAEFDPESFIPADYAALDAEWEWLGEVAGRGLDAGIGGMADDDLAYVRPWGFDPADVRAPTLLMHGTADRVVPVAHGEWLARHCAGAEFWRREGDGHISVLTAAESALAWLRENALE
ncbi:alpha/beta fold hydrolase [Glaciihabitans sp. dw_435]|uniref:alpha/beta fold hydrolase n=1 Tax=Glaciihabitans sp. dw_435 TaxID=2720081 RepID=UPI001BD44D7F|nr:alpha/beta fold hydrolase [Glaciihabitans sp. dw_435]